MVRSLFHPVRRLELFATALIITCWLSPVSAQINLSDIVAGGDGTGEGWTQDDDIDLGGEKYAAVNLDNGTFMTRAEVDQFHNNTVDTDGVNPSPCEGAPFAFPDDTGDIVGGQFIDSVFLLNSVDVPLNQEQIQFPYIPGDEEGNSWNHVLSNRTHDIDKGQEDIFAGGSANWETGVGIHASAGITFDLDAIREHHGADKVVSFSTFIGADRCGALINFYVIFSDDDGILDDPNGNRSFMDGNNEVRYWAEASSPASAAQYIGEIPEGARYLTLTVGDGGNGVGCDHGVLANPQILDFLPPKPVEDLTCGRNQEGDWEITWKAQEDPPPDPITVLVDGEEVGQVENTATSFTFPVDEAEGDFQVCVENGAPFQSCCRPAPLDGDGQIKKWLVVGPFANDFGCSGPDPEPLLGNFIAPSKIGCLYPEEGDELEYDSFEAASNDYVGPGEDPIWRVFDDGGDDGVQDLQAEAASNGWQNDDVMSWLVSYFTYLGDPIEPDLCVGSDDGVQVWIDNKLVWTNNACRGGGVCQDVVSGIDNDIEIEPGPHRVAIAAWERGGGWNARFGFQVDGLPVLSSDPDWIFHGTSKPDGLEAAPDCGESECERLELDPADLTVRVGRERQLTAKCFDEAGLPTNVTAETEFTVTPDGIISIDENGVVTGLAEGEAEVTATAQGNTATANVTVIPPKGPPELLLYYSFNDDSDPDVAIDDSGNDNDGEIILAQYSEDGLGVTGEDGDLAMDFQGPNDGAYINVPSAMEGAFDSINAKDAATITLWVKGGEAQPHDNSAFWFAGDTEDRVLQAHIPWSNSNIYFDVGGCCNPDQRINAATDIQFIRDEWNHYAFVKDETQTTIYQNGEIFLQSAPDAIASIEEDLITEVNIGSARSGGNSYNGLIDEFGVWDGALSQDEIQRVMDEGVLPVGPTDPMYKRGDANADGAFNISDGTFILNALFAGGPDPTCADAADANADGGINIADGVYVLNALFGGGEQPPAPFPDCGIGPNIGCEAFAPCP